MTGTITEIIVGLWVAFLLIWILASGWSARKVATHPASSQLIYRVIEVIGAFLLATPAPLAHRLFAVSPTLAGIALALVVVGMVFAMWARFHLGRNWSVDVSLKEGHAIIRTGPYGLARHPIYSGLLTALLGTVIARGTVTAALGFVVIAIAWVFKLRQEESLLSRHFGEQYATYRREVKRLIPYFW